MYKFWELVLGDVYSKIDPAVHYSGRKLDKSFIPGLEGPLKSFIKELWQKKLEQEMKGTSAKSDSVTRMLNGVQNI